MIVWLRRSLATAFAISAALTVSALAPLDAQARPRSPFERLGTDSVAWQRVLVYVVSAVSTDLVRTSVDPSAQPWDLQLPAGEPQRSLLEAQLRTILRARPIAAGDSVYRTLTLGPLVIRGDTARVHVSMNETRRCPGSARTAGSGWSTTVLVPREPKLRFWGAAFSRSTLAGERFGCPHG